MNMRTLLGGCLTVLSLWPAVGCTTTAPADPPPALGSARTFEEDVEFLRKHGPVEVLETPNGGKVALSPLYQGRVMTSAVGAGGRSLGFINYPFIAAGKTGTAFDNYGGEDRFWIAPEAGRYGYFFPRGIGGENPFTFEAWQTPAALQLGAWEMDTTRPDKGVLFSKVLELTNSSGARFWIKVERRVRALTVADLSAKLGLALPTDTRWVGFETVNRITNVGPAPFTAATGLPAIWSIGMFPASPDTHVVVPFDNTVSLTGRPVNDDYFGRIGADRLMVNEKDGYAIFKADGLSRGKIGVAGDRAMKVLGSYSASAGVLTVVNFDKPEGNFPYTNNEWKLQAKPYAGDVVNSYNDAGIVDPEGKAPTTATFYELETLSPALQLNPGESAVHTHRTIHFVGEPDTLEPIASRVLGVGVKKIAAFGK